MARDTKTRTIHLKKVDGSFFLSDQEGLWTPKNRINWVTADDSAGLLPDFSAYPGLTSAATYAIFLLVLLFRPEGLFGRTAR